MLTLFRGLTTNFICLFVFCYFFVRLCLYWCIIRFIVSSYSGTRPGNWAILLENGSCSNGRSVWWDAKHSAVYDGMENALGRILLCNFIAQLRFFNPILHCVQQTKKFLYYSIEGARVTYLGLWYLCSRGLGKGWGRGGVNVYLIAASTVSYSWHICQFSLSVDEWDDVLK